MPEYLASYMPVGIGRLSDFAPCTVVNHRWSLGIKTGVLGMAALNLVQEMAALVVGNGTHMRRTEAPLKKNSVSFPFFDPLPFFPSRSNPQLFRFLFIPLTESILNPFTAWYSFHEFAWATPLHCVKPPHQYLHLPLFSIGGIRAVILHWSKCVGPLGGGS